MPQKKHKPEEIVAKLRQVDVLVSQGQSVAEAVRSISVTQFTYYRWRKEFGGLKTVSATSRPYAVRLDGCACRQGMRSSMRDLGCPSRMARRVSAR